MVWEDGSREAPSYPICLLEPEKNQPRRKRGFDKPSRLSRPHNLRALCRETPTTGAHQYVSQLDPQVTDAVRGNAGTMITFRLGAEDAQRVAKEFVPELSALDLTTLPN